MHEKPLFYKNLCSVHDMFFSRFHSKSIFDTISWRTESCMHNCITHVAFFIKRSCLKHMIYLIQGVKTIKNTCNFTKHVSNTLWLSFYFKLCSEGCSVIFFVAKICFPLTVSIYFPRMSDIMRRLACVKLYSRVQLF